jgi:hypothetical protein
MSEINKLKIENKMLREKLAVAEKWMRNEVKTQVSKISKKKLKSL